MLSAIHHQNFATVLDVLFHPILVLQHDIHIHYIQDTPQATIQSTFE